MHSPDRWGSQKSSRWSVRAKVHQIEFPSQHQRKHSSGRAALCRSSVGKFATRCAWRQYQRPKRTVLLCMWSCSGHCVIALCNGRVALVLWSIVSLLPSLQELPWIYSTWTALISSSCSLPASSFAYIYLDIYLFRKNNIFFFTLLLYISSLLPLACFTSFIAPPPRLLHFCLLDTPVLCVPLTPLSNFLVSSTTLPLSTLPSPHQGSGAKLWRWYKLWIVFIGSHTCSELHHREWWKQKQ